MSLFTITSSLLDSTRTATLLQRSVETWSGVERNMTYRGTSVRLRNTVVASSHAGAGPHGIYEVRVVRTYGTSRKLMS